MKVKTGSAGASPIVRGYVTVARGQAHHRWLKNAGVSAQPVVMLHQVSSSSRMFDRIMPLIGEAGLAPVAPDLPGFGESDPIERVSIAGLATWAWRFADRVAVRTPLWLVGHHTGAGVAVEMALAAPDRVAGLILVGVPFFPTEAARRKRWRDKKVRQIIPLSDGGHLLREWQRLQDLSPSMDVSLLHREAVDTFRSDRYDLAYRAIFRWDAAARLPLLRCPTLVIAGTRDTLFPGQAPAAAAIPDSTVVTVQDGGVFMFEERTEELAGHAIRFMRHRGSGPRH